VLQWTFSGRYFTVGGQRHCVLNEVLTVNLIWKILHSRWTVALRLEWSVLQWTLSGRYFTAGGQWYCVLNVVCYSEHYLELLHSRCTVVLRLHFSLLQRTLFGRYFTASGQWYWDLNVVCYIEHYLEGTSLQVESGIAAWMKCVTVNIIWKVLHSRWTVVLRLEFSVLQWTISGSYCTAGGQWHFGLNVVCYSEHYI